MSSSNPSVVGSNFILSLNKPKQLQASTYWFRAVDVSGKADDQVMGDWINKVSEAGIAI